MRMLVITGDDYGYWPSYNEGILEAIEMGALDCVSAMVEREHCDPKPLLESGVEIGLHIEFEGRWGARSGAPAETALRVQLERFGDLFGRWPSFLNGHKHCHARPELATPVFQTAKQIGAPVRSVNPDHRQWLRERNIDTPDLLIGRTESKGARGAARGPQSAARRDRVDDPPRSRGLRVGLELRPRPPGGPEPPPEDHAARPL